MNVLVVVAHPDDEVLGCGGFIAKLVSSGHKVCVCFMTDGVGARGVNPDDRAIAERKESALKAQKILGISELFFHEFPDNAMDTVPLIEVVKCIEKVVKKVKPSMLITHSNCDLNVDHQITFRAAITACRPLPDQMVKKILCCEVLSSTNWSHDHSAPKFNPNLFVEIGGYEDIKRRAINAYNQELHKFPHARSWETISSLHRLRGSTVGVAVAEAFQVERIIDEV